MDPALARIPFDIVKRRIRRFCNVNNIVGQCTTHAAQNCTWDDNVVNDFSAYVRQEIKNQWYSPDCIVNLDKTNVDFDMVSSCTLADKGQHTISLKNNGSSQQCTVILAAAGEKLPAMVIFQGKKHRSRIMKGFGDSTLGYPQDLVYTIQEKAWNDTETMYEWIEKVWRPFFVERNRPMDMFWDEFSVHMKREIVHQIQNSGKQVDVIPGGYTGEMQILDKGINKPFKEKVQAAHIEWLLVNNSKPK